MAATPVSKKYFQLVNEEGQEPLEIAFGDSNSQIDDWRYCDWDINGQGYFRTISNEDATGQNTLKNVFTEKQPNGLGTNIYDLVGEKDIVVKRSSLFMDITMAMVTQKLKADAQAVAQNLSGSDLINTVSKLSVTDDATNPSQVNISMRLITQADEQVEIGVI